jgi:YceI-like domain
MKPASCSLAANAIHQSEFESELIGGARGVLLVTVVAALAVSASAKPTSIDDDAHGRVPFHGKAGRLSNVDGRSTETDAAITYNDSNLAPSSVTALIRVASIDTGEREPDAYAEVFRQSSQALDDLADAYQASGDIQPAAALFEKSVKFDPFDAHAFESLRHIL